LGRSRAEMNHLGVDALGAAHVPERPQGVVAAEIHKRAAAVLSGSVSQSKKYLPVPPEPGPPWPRCRAGATPGPPRRHRSASWPRNWRATSHLVVAHDLDAAVAGEIGHRQRILISGCQGLLVDDVDVARGAFLQDLEVPLFSTKAHTISGLASSSIFVIVEEGNVGAAFFGLGDQVGMVSAIPTSFTCCFGPYAADSRHSGMYQADDGDLVGLGEGGERGQAEECGDDRLHGLMLAPRVRAGHPFPPAHAILTADVHSAA